MLERIKLLIEDEQIKKIEETKVIIIGIGGVGGSALESLVRSGFKNITIVDNDVVEESNLNRQIISSKRMIGKSKCEAAKERMLSINPDLNLNTINSFIDENNINELNINEYDYVVDTQDTTNTKIVLIKESLKYNKRIICSMGTGNRFDPTKIIITNIWKTQNDPLAKKIRKLLRDERISAKIPVIASTELPKKINSTNIGSTPFVPNSAGLALSSYIFQEVIKK